MPASTRRFVPHAIIAFVLLAALAWSIPLGMFFPLPDGPDDFNSPGFVIRHSWVKFAYVATEPFRGSLSEQEKSAKVARYFQLNRLIADDEQVAGNPDAHATARASALAQLPKLRGERTDMANTVQRILEGRLTRVIKEAGLTRRFGGDVVWPPVNIEFQDPPSVLVTSPRNEIRKESETLLEGDLSIERVEQLEANAERDGKTSALVVQIGGIAMYPAIIPEDADYAFVMDDIAHEWMHHYLFFTPLGRRYFSSGKLTTLNETVADLVGQELGARLVAEYPLGPSYVSSGGVMASPAPAIDFVAEMRELRRQVEALLAQGKVDEAERLMEEKRRYLADNGYYIRKLNQAYFAFHGSYADSAGSIDPIGPKLDTLRKDSPTLKAFVERARELTSEADLDRALASAP
ncbi:MAG: hypothetical protein EPO22_01445 [Dehalococcoidia bacterium]|nr:MAG: hypothetical protein EPO22_01445 [Dehalococcoidia bacterium]